MPLSESRFSLFDILIPVTLVIPDGANPETTDDEVLFQLVLGGLPPRAEPTEDGWVQGSWIQPSPGPLLAAISCGPGGQLTPAVGRWAIWLRVVDNPTMPTKPVDQLVIF